MQLSFDGGTLLLRGGRTEAAARLPGCSWDPRVSAFRAEARHYRTIVESLIRSKIPYEDLARTYGKTPWELKLDREPFVHQSEAMQTWWKAGARGVVVLPTGTGKTFVAMLAIRQAARPALVVVPTIDLLNQWHSELSDAFGDPVGAVGGTNYDFQSLTVTTYDSAYLYVERWGNRYGLLVFDECHHLPGPSYQQIAIMSLAPFRLGLTATPERTDGGEGLFPALIGEIIYRREIKELSGEFLAPYRALKVFVELTPEEFERYTQAREHYRTFLAERGISLSGTNGWQRFVAEAYRSPEGWDAMKAYREQKHLERAASAKLAKLDDLLRTHQGDRILIFTADNATVYEIARRFLVPAITHQTKAKERKQILKRFHSGEYPVIVTSRVLNEGVDVPAANVGIVLSGTATIRENVQRLGRLLRKHGDKQAVLYEVIAKGTAEEFASDRRRQHHAFR